MHSRLILLLACAVGLMLHLPEAKAQYHASVLYETSVPAGVSGSKFSNFNLGAGGQLVGLGTVSGNQHALLWSSQSPTAIDLHPASLGSFATSGAIGTNGTQQVGWGDVQINGGFQERALMWNGSAASAVDLTPTNLGMVNYALASGTDGSHQMGYYASSAGEHAVLWNGSADSAVDLNPTNISGISQSYGLGVQGGSQVGYGAGTVTGNEAHALLWSGTANSAVDLNPTLIAGIIESYAYGVGGGKEVGQGFNGTNGHAFLWTGTAASAIDLNPTNLSGISESLAYATNGTIEVGHGKGSGTSNNYHALLWSGTAGSAVDLHKLLPATGTWTSSHAFAIDASGDVFGYAVGTLNGSAGDYAVEWMVPEPSSAMACLLAAGALITRPFARGYKPRVYKPLVPRGKCRPVGAASAITLNGDPHECA